MTLCAANIQTAMGSRLVQFSLIWINFFKAGVGYHSKPVREALFIASSQAR